MQDQPDPADPTPLKGAPNGFTHFHPLTQSGAALAGCLGTPEGQADLDRLADDLADVLQFEQIDDLADSAVMLALQSRVLDALFNRCTIGSFAEGMQPNLNVLRAALLAQRQCGQTIAQLRRTGPRARNQRIFDERTKGR